MTSQKRLPQLAEVPTVAEAGVAGYESTGWFGLVVPAGTPTAVTMRLANDVGAVLQEEAVRTSLRNMGLEPTPSTPEGFESFIRDETRKWGQVIRNANLRLE